MVAIKFFPEASHTHINTPALYQIWVVPYYIVLIRQLVPHVWYFSIVIISQQVP